jgi:tetratricopeptide (TPR) repeat protein
VVPTTGTTSDLLAGTGRPTNAAAELRQALAIQEKLIADYPAVTEFRSDLANIRVNFGELLSKIGDPSGAEVEYRKALALYRKLADDRSEFSHDRNRAARAEVKRSVVLRRLGRPAEALDHCRRVVAVREAMVREEPKTVAYRYNLAENYLNLGLARRDLGDPAGAVADLRRALGQYDALPLGTASDWFLVARSHAALSGLAGRDGSGLSPAEATSEAETAMALLHKSVGMGYRDPDAYRTEDALDPLRSRPDFRLLLMDLAFPAKPFTKDMGANC